MRLVIFQLNVLFVGNIISNRQPLTKNIHVRDFFTLVLRPFYTTEISPNPKNIEQFEKSNHGQEYSGWKVSEENE